MKTPSPLIDAITTLERVLTEQRMTDDAAVTLIALHARLCKALHEQATHDGTRGSAGRAA